MRNTTEEIKFAQSRKMNDMTVLDKDDNDSGMALRDVK